MHLYAEAAYLCPIEWARPHGRFIESTTELIGGTVEERIETNFD
jgi:hypothetical protein